MKCSFCEQPLECRECHRPFRPKVGETLAAAYQPDMEVMCPECGEVLACRWCGHVYGDPGGEEGG